MKPISRGVVIARQTMAVLGDREADDDAKETAAQSAALSLLGVAAQILFWTAIALAPAAVVASLLLATGLTSADALLRVLLSPWFIGLSVLICAMRGRSR